MIDSERNTVHGWRRVTMVAVALCLGGHYVPVAAQTACDPGTAEAYLDVGNVRAKILNNGGLFWNGAGINYAYEVPKGGGVHSIIAANLWIGGMVDDELRTAATTYGPWEFWPGPIVNTTASLDSCAEYDRIWEVRIDDLQGGWAAERNLSTWPTEVGAPFIDVDGDGAYQPGRGDRPELLGDQQLWWVMNDASGPHLSSKSDSLAIEIRATAFAFDTPGAVGNSTFYRYRIRNASAHPIMEMFAGLYTDTDLGVAFDDYTGSDSTLGMGYSYNADNDDDTEGGGYGTSPPAIGFTVLERPSTTLLDQAACQYPDNHPVGFTNVMHFFNGGGVTGSPDVHSDFYNYMQSRWKDGHRMTYGGNGRDFSAIPVRFAFPGDPVTHSFWSEINQGCQDCYSFYDRRFINGLGPFCMAPGEEVELVIAIVWSRGDSHLDSVRQLREDVAYIQSIRDVILTPRTLPAGKSLSLDPEMPFAASVYPNPVGGTGGGGGGSALATVRLSTPEALEVSVTVFNALGQRIHVAAEPDLVDAGDHSWTLPTANWLPGVYLVRISAGHTVTTRRLVIT